MVAAWEKFLDGLRVAGKDGKKVEKVLKIPQKQTVIAKKTQLKEEEEEERKKRNMMKNKRKKKKRELAKLAKMSGV